MLKTSGSTESTTRPKKGGVGVGVDGKAKRGGIDDSATHFDAQDKHINGFIN